MPVMTSIFDENATRKFLILLDKLKPVRKGKRAVAVVGNRMRLRTKAAENLDGFLDDVGQHAVAALRDTQLYGSAAMLGQSIFDYNDKRALNFLQDWRPLLTFIDDTTAKCEKFK